MIANLELPAKLQPLFQPYRYKILHGGRGSAKSHSVARALLIKGAAEPLRILCARELQNSIKDSVHKLLADLIRQNKLEDFYQIQGTTIIGKNGTEFLFEGLKHNIDSVKSKEGIDIVWVEEAHMVSKSSWEILIPTIRKEGSEIWITFNPELETDETYQRFIVNPPKDSIVIEMNWRDNPWFSKVLMQELEDLKEKSMDDYLHVWEGKPRQALEGAVYADELRQLTIENRLTTVPYNPTIPVYTYWDLGYADNTSIWFVQKVGMEIHLIDFYENNAKSLQHYIGVLNEKGYVYAMDCLPHDAKAKQMGTGMSVEEQMRALGRKIKIIPKLSISDGIAAARSVFPMVWIDKDKCAEGVNSLRHYRYEVTESSSGQLKKDPIHDQYSHASDSFRYFAVDFKQLTFTQEMNWEQAKRKYGSKDSKVVGGIGGYARR